MWTFGIITCGSRPDKVKNVVDSILSQGIPAKDFEIIIVGGDKDYETNIAKIISFDEKIKPKWITKKKNIIAERAKFENIVFLHDYVCLGEGWYKSMCEFGNEWDACMVPLKYENGERAIDWLLQPYHAIPNNRLKEYLQSKHPNHPLPNDMIKLPYEFENGELSKFQYLPGNFFMLKKAVALEFPQNEEKGWDEGEDLEQGQKISSKYKFKLNKNTYCQFKQGGRPPGHRYISDEICYYLKQFVKENE